jgi:simple sugar transport system permease protein
MSFVKNKQQLFDKIFISVFSIILSLIVGAIVIACLGSNPIQAYGALIEGSMGSLVAFSITLKKSVPLILSGLAVAIAFKCSVFNIGVEGQLMAGALTATIAGAYINLPAPLHILVVMLAAILGGMLSALVPALLKTFNNVSVVISTIMFNYIIKFFVQFCIMGPMKGSGSSQSTIYINDTAFLPSILPRPYQMNLGFLILILVIILVSVLFNKTTYGYEMKMVGLNPIASKIQGINIGKNMFLALLISGAIAGLAGGIEIAGSLKKDVLDFSVGYGFAGIPIALMAQNNPYAIILTGLFFGIMSSGSFLMQSKVGVSPDIIDLIKGLVVVFFCMQYFIQYHVDSFRRKRRGKC